MKNRFSNGRLSYFFTPRIHRNILAWVMPAPLPEGGERGIENILRWEEDGGRIIEINDPIPNRQFVQPVQIHGGMHDISLQWNEQFVIEPFQAGRRIDWIKRNAPTNRPSM